MQTATNRMGLTDNDNPEKIEYDLMKIVLKQSGQILPSACFMEGLFVLQETEMINVW